MVMYVCPTYRGMITEVRAVSRKAKSPMNVSPLTSKQKKAAEQRGMLARRRGLSSSNIAAHVESRIDCRDER